MESEKKERIKNKKKKYIWLHRLNVSLFLFAVLRIVSIILNNSEINTVFGPIIILFLIYSLVRDADFLFKKKFYYIMGFFSAFLSLSSGANFRTLHWRIDLFGLDTISILLFIFLSSVFVFIKVFEMELKEI